VNGFGTGPCSEAGVCIVSAVLSDSVTTVSATLVSYLFS
jgi:hypothetical protein